VLYRSTAAGAKIILMHHFNAGQALEIIERERVSMIGGVPTIAMQIIDHPDFEKYDTSSVANIAYGGAPAPPNWSHAFALTSHGTASNGYGLTETSAASPQTPAPTTWRNLPVAVLVTGERGGGRARRVRRRRPG